MRKRPTITALCGSTRFREAYAKAFRDEEHAGRICLSVPCYKDDPCCKTPEDHARLDELHLAKIDLADEVLVLNVLTWTCGVCGKPVRYDPKWGGHSCADCGSKRDGDRVAYVGDSTRREIAYAEAAGKVVRYLNPPTTP